MTCSGFEGDVDILAVRSDNDDLVAISVYEKGAKTMKGSTKAIHVNIFPHSTGWQMVTDDGWELIHRSILYALGQIPFDVAPEDKLAVTLGTNQKVAVDTSGGVTNPALHLQQGCRSSVQKHRAVWMRL